MALAAWARLANVARMESSRHSPLTYALAGLVALSLAMGLGRFVYTPILPSMMEELGLSASDAGLIASSNFAGYLLGAVLASLVGGQGRERLIGMSALIANAILLAAMALSESVHAFLVIRFFAGMASAFVLIFLITLVMRHLVAAGRGELQNVYFSGVGIGIASSSLLIGWLASTHAGWQAGWIWTSIVAFVGAAIVFALVDEPYGSRSVPAERALPMTPDMVRIIVAYGFSGFGYVVTATFLIAIVRQGEAGTSAETLVWTVTGIAAAISVWFWNRIARRSGKANAFAGACAFQAVGVAASVAVGGVAGPLIGGALLGLTFMATTALGFQIAHELATGAQRRAVALLTVSFGIGQILGPLIAGFVADRTGSFTAPSMLAAGVLIAAAIIARGIRS